MERVLTALIYQLDQIRVFGEDRQRMTSCIKTLQDILEALRKGPPEDEQGKAIEKSSTLANTVPATAASKAEGNK